MKPIQNLTCCVCGVLGNLAPVHRCACLLCAVACAVSWATWLLLTGVHVQCVVLCVRCPGPLGFCSPVCVPVALCCVCGFLIQLAPVHQCVCSLCCVACAVSWATWLLFTGVHARCAVLRVRCPGPRGSCSPLCLPGVLCYVCVVSGHMAPVNGVRARFVVLLVRCPGPLGSCHRCARSVSCAMRAALLDTWLLLT